MILLCLHTLSKKLDNCFDSLTKIFFLIVFCSNLFFPLPSYSMDTGGVEVGVLKPGRAIQQQTAQVRLPQKCQAWLKQQAQTARYSQQFPPLDPSSSLLESGPYPSRPATRPIIWNPLRIGPKPMSLEQYQKIVQGKKLLLEHVSGKRMKKNVNNKTKIAVKLL